MRRMIPDNKWKEVKNATEPLSFDSANRVLTIDSDLQMTGDILVADPDEQSVEKIYFHPIILVYDTTPLTLSFIILDNSPTPYDTWAKVKTKLTSIAESIEATARIVTTGAIYTDSQQLIASHLDVQTSGQIYCYGLKGTARGNFRIDTLNIDGVYDGVNPIN